MRSNQTLVNLACVMCDVVQCCLLMMMTMMPMTRQFLMDLVIVVDVEIVNVLYCLYSCLVKTNMARNFD